MAKTRVQSEVRRLADLAEAVFTATDEAILITDARQTILRVNPAFERVTGYGAGEAIGQTPRMLSSGRHDKQFYEEMWARLLKDGHWHGEIWNRRKSGELYVQRVTLSVLRDEQGRVVNYVAVFNDITSSKREADRFRHLANHDSLTRLPNRILLQDRTEQALAQAARGGGQAALLFLDLDGFKEINDQLGHLMGDHVLEAVAGRLCRCVRESDTVARLGGDEFVIFLPSIKSAGDVRKLGDKLLMVLSEPMVFGEVETRVGVSVGIALYPHDGETSETLLAAADAAMYRAKRQGGGRVVMAG
jgi:diguanylate cyclase (GGDEF)-like protein/PAS domain S-box-containing protein